MRLAPEFQSSLFKKEKTKVENIPQKAPESSESQNFKALTSLSLLLFHYRRLSLVLKEAFEREEKRAGGT